MINDSCRKGNGLHSTDSTKKQQQNVKSKNDGNGSIGSKKNNNSKADGNSSVYL